MTLTVNFFTINSEVNCLPCTLIIASTEYITYSKCNKTLEHQSPVVN